MKKLYLLCYLLPVLAAVTSCKKSNVPVSRGEDLVLTAAEQQKADADNVFTLKMLKQLATDPAQNKNLIFSPLSISIAIAMTSNGSNGQTLEDIRKTMEFQDFTEAQINSYYNKIITKLPVLDPLANVKLANSIWYVNGFNVLPAFLQTNREDYKATAEALDFASPAAKDKINNWVSDNTNGKINKMIEEIPGDIIMYLINALYFKSSWKYPFDKSKTVKKTFLTADKSNVQADFMNGKVTLKAAHHSNVSIYELPYGNDKYSMLILLPVAGRSVTEMISTLDAATWKTWTGNLEAQTTEVSMPKFKFSYKTELKEALGAMGMERAFSPGADFSRIQAGGGLRISEVKHKALIEVNEEGTEAAAVTVVGMGLTSAGPAVADINRPFLFAVREMKTGLILFSGVVNNPLLAE